MQSEYKICTHCVMDTSDPDIEFDQDGVCIYCRAFKVTEAQRKSDKTDLPWIYHNLRKAGRGKEYDCLLGLSGGVDSSLCLHYLKENDIRPLCFSVDNGWNTSESDENIMRLVETLKVPFFRYTIDLPTFHKLQVAFIDSATPNIEIPTDHILMATSYQMAREYRIKHIISGGNIATESIMPKAWGYNARDLRFIKDVYKRHTNETLKGLPTLSLFGYILSRFLRGIDVINLLDYYEYNRDDAKKLLAEKYGWKDYGEKHNESVFTKWFQEQYLPARFGYDKRRAHFSSLINSGQMTRDQAIEFLAQRPASPQTIKIGKSIISVSNWDDAPKRTHRDYKNSEAAWDRLGKLYGNFKKRR